MFLLQNLQIIETLSKMFQDSVPYREWQSRQVPPDSLYIHDPNRRYPIRKVAPSGADPGIHPPPE